MNGVITRIFRDLPADVRFSIAGVYTILAAANIGAWVWAWIAFHAHPVLLVTASLAYGFGLRQAVDADHIAAIDNVVRKLMQEGKRPVSVGVFFSLGHSTVVTSLLKNLSRPCRGVAALADHPGLTPPAGPPGQRYRYFQAEN